jgi:hypothetical protein
MAPVVALLGFGLFERGFPVVGRCVEVGLPMLILFVVLSQYLKNVQIKDIPVLERFSLFICIALVWAYAQILTSGGAYKNSTEVTQINCRTDRANLISSAPWIKIPYPLQWGAPTFNAGQSFGMVSAVLVSLIEVMPLVTVQPWILSLQLSNDKLTSTMSPLDSPQPLTRLLLVLQVRLHLQLIS